MRIGIVLFNLGGPDRLEAVRPFLFNLFSDPAIIGLPGPLRRFVAWLIARRRAPVAAGIYKAMGGRSPILQETEAQAEALAATLTARRGGDVIKVVIAMRYWHPFTDAAKRELAGFRPDRVVLLPLYPQYSTTTSASSLKAWMEAEPAIPVPEARLCCYPDQPGFIAAMAESTRAAVAAAEAEGHRPRLLLTAHGLPEKVVRRGDPYQAQVERTATALLDMLGRPDIPSVVCYQSRVGPLKWIGPSTDAEVEATARAGLAPVLVPLAFVSEHSETLVELDIEYRHLALEKGAPGFHRAATVRATPSFIEGLADLVEAALAEGEGLICGASGGRCDAIHGGCPWRGRAETR